MTETAEPAYPLLHDFFRGYFNEDWDLEFGTPENALEHFLWVSRESEIRELLDELATFLRKDPDEQDRVFDRFRSHFPPKSGVPSLQEWMRLMHRRVLWLVTLFDTRVGGEEGD